MKRLLMGMCVLGVLMIPDVAQASPWNRGCNTHGGYVNADQTLQVTGFVHIAMSQHTAARIARRVGPGEFGTPTHARDMPCDVAQNVANDSLHAYNHWHLGRGTIRGYWQGYQGSVYLGRFSCSAASDRGLPSHETCHHATDRHAGAITVRFVVSSAVD